MLIARDLRVGNLISCEREDDDRQFTNKIGESYGRQLIHEVYQIFETSIQCIDEDGEYCRYQLNCCQGIPLTPEWLTKCGFVKVSGREGWEWKKEYFTIGQVSYFFIEGNGFSIKISTVHHLQNLFHVLTGKELEIK